MATKVRTSLSLVISALLIITAGQNVAVAETNPYGGVAVPPPAANEIIFKVVNRSKSTGYSMKSLRALKSKTIKIYEPFVKKSQTFTVIPLSVFTQKSKISDNSVIKTIALNDYVYANTVKNFLGAQAFLAIALNGKPIPYDQGGPIRLIYPKNSVWVKNLDAWNWSLSSIAVK